MRTSTVFIARTLIRKYSMTPPKITEWVDPKDSSGEFKRQQSSFRHWISRDPGATFPPATGRYHLYVSHACPWAHRTLIARQLKRLEGVIGVTAVHWHMGERGWRFASAAEGAESGDARGHHVHPDPHSDATHLRDVYLRADPGYNARFTVPVLFDTQTKQLVSNESSEILRMLNSEFDEFAGEGPSKSDGKEGGEKVLDLYPQPLRADIDAANAWIYDLVNNGVYKSGFATTQEAYGKNVAALFGALDRVEAHLGENKNKNAGPFWFGETLTEVDVRLFTTIIRFDAVYVQHFKCNIRDIRSGYPHIHAWLRNLYWRHPAFADTTNFLHIKKHYTVSHPQINPLGITPVGPLPDILPLDEEVEAVGGVAVQRK